MKFLTIRFDNFFEYQTTLEILNSELFTPKHPNPDELTLSFTYLYRYEIIINYLVNICKPLNIQFTTTIEVTEDTE